MHANDILAVNDKELPVYCVFFGLRKKEKKVQCDEETCCCGKEAERRGSCE
jgi:hypothetical protein